MAKMLTIALGAGVMIFLGGCAGHRPPRENPGVETTSLKNTPDGVTSSLPGPSKKGVEVIAHAEAFAKAGKLPSSATRDCSGFVLAAYRAAGAPLAVPVESQRDRNL